MYDASGGVSIRQKIIDEKDAVLVGQELAVYTHVFFIVSCKGPDP